MPEGPSIVILKEAVQQFSGQKIILASGNNDIDVDRLQDQTVISFKSWGKHFLICFEEFTLKIHLLLFGTYRINERKEAEPRLHLTFINGEINFYTCTLTFLEGDINSYYDWTADIMNEKWNARAVQKKLKTIPKQMICDVLLNQNIFSGVGNIIKNEVLYRAHVHPESIIEKIPTAVLKKVIDESSYYSFDFLKWKSNNVFKDHWRAYSKKICHRCNLAIERKKTGKIKRVSFYCTNCQKLYK